MKIIGFLVALVFFVGGLYLLGLAFQVEGLETLVFLAGILAASVGLAIPFHVMKRIDG